MHEMFDRIVTLKVSDVMTHDPVTVESSASLSEVAQLFARRGLHAAPVVDEQNVCVGIITSSDFVKRAEIFARFDGETHELFHGEEGLQVEPRSYDTVADCMTHGVQSITPTMAMIKAARIMTEAHIHVLPVVEQHRAVGIISNIDVVSALVNAFDEAKNTI